MTHLAGRGYYTIESGIRKLSAQVSANYDQNGLNPVTTTPSQRMFFIRCF